MLVKMKATRLNEKESIKWNEVLYSMVIEHNGPLLNA